MPIEHTPKIRKPTPEELDAAIGRAESKGMYGLLGALLELKQLRCDREFIGNIIHAMACDCGLCRQMVDRDREDERHEK